MTNYPQLRNDSSRGKRARAFIWNQLMLLTTKLFLLHARLNSVPPKGIHITFFKQYYLYAYEM